MRLLPQQVAPAGTSRARRQLVYHARTGAGVHMDVLRGDNLRHLVSMSSNDAVQGASGGDDLTSSLAPQ